MNYEREEKRRWHFSKEVSVVDVLTILVAGGAMTSAWISVKQDIAILQTEAAERKQIIASMKSDFESALNRIEGKLDRLIERRK